MEFTSKRQTKGRREKRQKAKGKSLSQRKFQIWLMQSSLNSLVGLSMFQKIIWNKCFGLVQVQHLFFRSRDFKRVY